MVGKTDMVNGRIKEAADELTGNEKPARRGGGTRFGFTQRKGKIMSNTQLIILIIVLLLLFGGGGFFWSRRR